MAGDQLYKFIKAQGSKANEQADFVYGTVLSTKPLKVQISNSMVITEDFIELGKHIGKFKVQGKAHVKGKNKVTVKSHHDTIEPISGNRPTVDEETTINEEDLKFPKTEFYLEIDNSLEEGDKVGMIRGQGGQRFYLFERLGKDGFGF